MVPLPELLSTLSPAAFRAFVSAFGPIPGLAANATPLAAAKFLFAYPAAYPNSLPAAGTPRLPAKHARFLLSVLPRFGTEGGRSAFVEAGRALGDPHAETWLAVNPVDVAVRLAVEEATTKGAPRRRARLHFLLAGLRLDRDLPERITYELRANAPVDPNTKSVLARLERAMGSRFVRAWHACDADGTRRLALFLRQPTRGALHVDESASEGFKAGVSTTVAVDEIRIAPDGLRVSITLARPDLLPVYAAALDLSLHSSYTLRPFQSLTAADLRDVSAPRVDGIELVGARKRGPNGERSEDRGPELDPSKLSGTGYLDRLTARVTVDKVQKVDAFLQLPHRFDISDRSYEVPVRAALAAVGTFSPGSLPDDARSLEPNEHGGWRWSEVVGDATFERMQREGRFLRVKAAHVATREHRMHGLGYVVRDVPGEPGMQYALAEDRSLGARIVSAEDRTAWRLDLAVLQRSMMADLGSTADDAPLVHPGLIDLGFVALTSGRLRVVYAMGTPAPGWIEAIRRVCDVGVTPVVLVPRGHASDVVGMLPIELDVHEQLGAKRIGRALGRAASALRVASQVEPWRLHEEELIVDPATKRTWLVGVALALTENVRNILEYLGKNADKVTPTETIGKHVSISGHPSAAARRTKIDAERQVTACLEQAGADTAIATRLILSEGHKGYRLGVSVRIV